MKHAGFFSDQTVKVMSVAEGNEPWMILQSGEQRTKRGSPVWSHSHFLPFQKAEIPWPYFLMETVGDICFLSDHA